MKNAILKDITIGIDFDHHPAYIIEKTRSLNLQSQCTVHLVHTLQFMPETYYDHYSVTTAQLDINIQKLKEQSIREAEEKLINLQRIYSDLSIEIHLLEGSSVDGIIDCANKNKSELIILGNYHKPGLIRLLGSTINGVMQQAPCDVLVVKT